MQEEMLAKMRWVGRIASFVVVVSWLVLIGLGAPARASVVRLMDLAALTEQSSLILHATVRDVRSYWKGNVIVTDITFEVLERLKGLEGPPVFVLTQLGGIVGTMGMRLEGDARFSPGEEVVVFLESSRNNPAVNYWVTGMAQGKFLVTREPVAGEKVVQGAALDGIGLLGSSPAQADGSRRTRPFAAFRDDVLKHVQGHE